MRGLSVRFRQEAQSFQVSYNLVVAPRKGVKGNQVYLGSLFLFIYYFFHIIYIYMRSHRIPRLICGMRIYALYERYTHIYGRGH